MIRTIRLDASFARSAERRWTRTTLVRLAASNLPSSCSRPSYSTSVDEKGTKVPQKTCLHSLHVEKKGKLVDFAGFLMPMQYAGLSIVDSHLHTRAKASVFDVSHMLQTRVHGRDGVEFMESLTVADVKNLKENGSTLTLFTSGNGGIIDDLIVTKTSEGHLYVVSNAGCIDKDTELMDAQAAKFRAAGKDVTLEYMSNSALVALQGPRAAGVLTRLVDLDLSKQAFMTSRTGTLCGVSNCRITRCGYTGEDGFELSMPADQARGIVENILSSSGDVKLAGLGARDTLRLEAGLCLYGHEMDEKTSPVEAGLVWTIGKARREQASFPGADVILRQIREKPLRKRIGLKAVEGGPSAREGSAVLDSESDQRLGSVTSGCPSPSLKENICMAYVRSDKSKIGTRVLCEVRGKSFPYEVVKMPFVPTKYFIP